MGNFTISGFADEIDSSLTVQMDELEKLNLRHIEMRGVNGKNLMDHTTADIRAIKKALDQRGFRISAVGSPFGKTKIGETFDKDQAYLEKAIEAAQILETKHIRVFSFFLPEDQPAEQFRSEIFRRYEYCLNRLQKANLVFLQENETGTYGATVERCLDLMEHFNSPHLKMTMDLGNFVKSGVKDNLDAVKTLKDHVHYIHVKDAIFGQAHFVPFGEGEGKAIEVLNYLKTQPRDYFLSIEAHLQYLPLTGPQQFQKAHAALLKVLSAVPGHS